MRRRAVAAPVNLISNGAFVDGTGWTFTPGDAGTAFTVAGGQLVYTSTSSGSKATAVLAIPGLSAYSGLTLTLTYDLIAIAGSCRPLFGLGNTFGTNNGSLTIGNGLTVNIVVGSTDENLFISASNLPALGRNYTIDNLILTPP